MNLSGHTPYEQIHLGRHDTGGDEYTWEDATSQDMKKADANLTFSRKQNDDLHKSFANHELKKNNFDRNNSNGGGSYHPRDYSSPLILFGTDISRYHPRTQFFVCAAGVFGFMVIHGVLREALVVSVAGRQYPLFLTVCQFAGYALWSLILSKMNKRALKQKNDEDQDLIQPLIDSENDRKKVPMWIFVFLACIRALDVAMTYMAFHYLNPPVRTFIRSSSLAFTFLIGLVIGRHRYQTKDYFVVLFLVLGLALFLQAETTTSDFYNPIGVIMLFVALLCEGALSNFSEEIMSKYSINQDEYHCQLYSTALVLTYAPAFQQGMLSEPFAYFFLYDGTIPEQEMGLFNSGWTAGRKILLIFVFVTSGVFGASCLGAITKRFGALCMSETITARKATVVFLSFAVFPNPISFQHAIGIILFFGALLLQSTASRHQGRVDGFGTDDDVMSLFSKKSNNGLADVVSGAISYTRSRLFHRDDMPDTKTTKSDKSDMTEDVNGADVMLDVTEIEIEN